jgi:uncharacterized protein YuzE
MYNSAMRFTCNSRYNIAYIRFQEKDPETEAIHVSDELIVDIAPDGTIYGIELLNANVQLRQEDGGSWLSLTKQQENTRNFR